MKILFANDKCNCAGQNMASDNYTKTCQTHQNTFHQSIRAKQQGGNRGAKLTFLKIPSPEMAILTISGKPSKSNMVLCGRCFDLA